MNELIKVNFDTQTVSARDLHEGLKIGTKFATWFPRMTEYGFQENADYQICYPNLGSESHGGQNMIDYQISIDMAKQICMIQRTDKGKQYRQYFIDLEKAWNTPEQIFARALKMAEQTIQNLKTVTQELTSEINVKDQLIGELKPKADYMDKILKNPGLVTITQISKDYGMSAQEMNQKLHELGIQFKQSGQWLLYRQFHSMGYTHSETVDIVRANGTPDVKMNTKWTQKGRLFLYNELKKEGILPIIEQTEK